MVSSPQKGTWTGLYPPSGAVRSEVGGVNSRSVDTVGVSARTPSRIFSHLLSSFMSQMAEAVSSLD